MLYLEFTPFAQVQIPRLTKKKLPDLLIKDYYFKLSSFQYHFKFLLFL